MERLGKVGADAPKRCKMRTICGVLLIVAAMAIVTYQLNNVGREITEQRREIETLHACVDDWHKAFASGYTVYTRNGTPHKKPKPMKGKN